MQKRSEHLLERLAFGLGLLTLGVPAAVLLLQAAYRLFPAQPTAAVVRLETEAAQRPFLFENGYRLAGWLAPDDMDPVAVGRCVFPDVEERARAVAAGADPEYTSREQDRARQTACMNGHPPRSLGSAIADAKVTPDWRLEHWRALGQETPDPVLLDRAQTIWNEGHTRLGTANDRPYSDTKPLRQLAQWRMASAVHRWQEGRDEEALETWAQVAGHAMRATGDDLSETNRSIEVLTQWFLSLQVAFASTQRLDDATAHQATALLSTIDALPQALHRSLFGEWHTSVQVLDHLRTSVNAKWDNKTNTDNQIWFLGWRLVFETVYDPVDGINLYTRDFETQRQRLLEAADGSPTHHTISNNPCPWLGPTGYVCIPFERNPVGRWLSRTSLPYEHHGTRVADLRNLAAATRLTIEARRQGLSGEALAHFIAQAPDDMRDVFTRQPFAYNLQSRELTIVLRHKSTVLGDAGEYRLPL